MNITKAQYSTDFDGNNSGIKATIDEQEMFVPLDPNNSDYAAIQKWVAEGNTIAEAD